MSPSLICFTRIFKIIILASSLWTQNFCLVDKNVHELLNKKLKYNFFKFFEWLLYRNDVIFCACSIWHSLLLCENFEV